MSDLVPDGWNFDFLPAFIEINPSFDKTLKLTDNTDVSFIKMEDVSNGAVVKNLRKRKYSEVKKGFTKFINHDVLVAKITPCFENGKGGHVKNLTNGVGFGSTEFHVFRAKKNSDSSYFYHFSNYPTFRLQAEASMCGTGGQRRVQTDFFRTFKTTYPPLPEQQKIAAILSSVDEVIEKTQAQINKLKDLKTGMMQELLSPREDQAANINNPQGDSKNGLHHTEFKDSPLGRIPAGWEVLPLDQVSKVIDCKHATPKYFNDGFAVVKPGNIKEGNLDLTGCAMTNKDGFENLNENHKPVVGDTIYSRNQTYGIGAYVFKEMEFAIGQDVCIIHPKTCLPKYLYYTVNAPIVKHQVELLAAGSTFKRINLGAIRQLLIPVPSQVEQKIIENTLVSIDEKANSITKKLTSLKSIKKALMQDLLTGKVRVQVDAA